MSNLKWSSVSLYAKFWCLIFLLPLSSCFKNDLDEFKEIGSYSLARNMAIPLFAGKLRIQDSIPYLEALNLSDTVSLGSLRGNEAEFNKLESIEIKLNVKNSFPIHGSVQFYFVDQFGHFTDSLFNIQRKPVDAALATNYSESVVYFYMDNEKFQRLMNAQDLQVVYFLDTPGNRNLPDYELDVELGMIVRTKKK